jgi:hypothetical protein
MSLKNSFASDFITSPITGFSADRAGAGMRPKENARAESPSA